MEENKLDIIEEKHKNDLKTSYKRDYKILIIVISIFIPILLLATYAIWSLSLSKITSNGEGASAGTALGYGIAAVLIIPLVILFSVASTAISTTCFALSLVARKSISRKVKITSIVYDVLFGLLLISSVIRLCIISVY